MGVEIDIISFANKRLVTSETEHYIKLTKPYANIKNIFLKSFTTKGKKNYELMRREGDLISSKWGKGSYNVALSEEGKLLTSKEFSEWISKIIISNKRITFNIGSAYGLSEEFKSDCNDVISLSPLTFPYGLTLNIIVEQIYRGFTIISGHPYSK